MPFAHYTKQLHAFSRQKKVYTCGFRQHNGEYLNHIVQTEPGFKEEGTLSCLVSEHGMVHVTGMVS